MKNSIINTVLITFLFSCHSYEKKHFLNIDTLGSNDSITSLADRDSVEIDNDITLFRLREVFFNLLKSEVNGKYKGEFDGECVIDQQKFTIKYNHNNLNYIYSIVNDTCCMYSSFENKDRYRYRFVVQKTNRYIYILPYVIDKRNKYSYADSLSGFIIRDNKNSTQYFMTFRYDTDNNTDLPFVKSIMQLDSFLYPQKVFLYKKNSPLSDPFIGKVFYDDNLNWKYINKIDTIDLSYPKLTEKTKLFEIESFFNKVKFSSSKCNPIVNPSLSYMYLWFWRGENNFNCE